ncbi:membrane protein [Streptomyces sp. NBRC 13847]|uniref:chaplin n=1 Tax=Streptomyces TaxID=1883 RepID=UPI0024A19A3D|nr:chaplin [Streptomyces sp. NBRC 13847]GLW18593.1 membrane protein [Streptomyces sp. NBRC 13847]
MSRIAKTLVVSAAAGMALIGAAGTALADTGAGGAALNAPGYLSGNVLQLPINEPINTCGNTLGTPGLLNPASGNTCATR